jgi:hypothetical protein
MTDELIGKGRTWLAGVPWCVSLASWTSLTGCAWEFAGVVSRFFFFFILLLSYVYDAGCF